MYKLYRSLKEVNDVSENTVQRAKKNSKIGKRLTLVITKKNRIKANRNKTNNKKIRNEKEMSVHAVRLNNCSFK